MKKTKKIAKIFSCFLAVLIFVLSLNLSAFAASTIVSFSKSQLNVGDTVNVTVKFSPGKTMYAVEGLVSYDSSVLKFVSGDGANGSGGSVKIVLAASSSSASTTLSFKAIAAGKSSVSVSQCSYVNESEQTVSIDGASGSLSVIDKSAQSADAYLKSLEVSQGNLYPAFSKSVYNYSVTVENDVKSVSIGAQTSNQKARFTVSGSDSLSVGNNYRVITVTAENGGTKKYTVVINRKAKGGTDETTSDAVSSETVNTDLSVTVEGETYYLSNNLQKISKPDGFSVDEIEYQSEKIPADVSGGEYSLVYATDKNGENGKAMLYDGENFSLLKRVKISDKYYILIDASKESAPQGYELAEITVKKKNVLAYKLENGIDSSFAFVYCLGSTGEKVLYCYDLEDGTIIRMPESFTPEIKQTVAEAVTENEQKNTVLGFDMVTVLFITAGVLMLTVLVLSILLFVAKSKIKK